MAGLLPGLPIHVELLAHLRHIKTTPTDEDGITHLTDLRKRLARRGRHPDGWQRLLIRLGKDAHVVEGVIFPLIREAFLSPGFQDHLETLVEALAALPVWDAIALVGPRKTTPPDSKVEAPLADLVDRGGFLGQADGMAQG